MSLLDAPRTTINGRSCVEERQWNETLIQHTGRKLVEFAESVGLPFRFDQMATAKEENFDRIEVSHTLIAKLFPQMIVLVEEEQLNFFKISSMFHVEFFCEAIQHYTALSDSLLHSFKIVGFRWFQKEIMGPRIMDSVWEFSD